MLFGLTNALIVFMRLMNHILRYCIGKFTVVYFDDILVYNRNLDLHLQHLIEILYVPRKNKLFVKIDKYTFCVDSVVFFSFIVNRKGVYVDPAKTKATQKLPTLKNVGDVRSFHGLAKFC